MLDRAAAAVIAAVLALPPVPPAAGLVCTVTDDRLTEMSGLAVIAGGYVTVNDKTGKADRRRIFFLSDNCQVTRAVAYPKAPTDTEDLAVARDGTVWVADIGDNDSERQTIGLWQLAPGAEAPAYHELRYPDRAHNAETLVLDGDGTPIVITKDPAVTTVYTGRSGTLRKAGTIALPGTTTGNPRGAEGRSILTGGSTSPDGTKVVVRTYADAFEFRVDGGDVIAALTSGTAQVTALPDEPQGESIAYTPDGADLLTVSESAGPDQNPAILRYGSKLSNVPAEEPDGPRVWIAAAGAGAVALVLSALAAVRLRRRSRR